MATIKFKRGLEVNLPIGEEGEPLWTTDTLKLYISDGVTNHLINSPDFILSVSDTNTIDLDVTSDDLTANVNYQNTSTINISEDGSGLKADLASGAAVSNLGYTPENVTNKSTNTSLGTSDTEYPTQNAVKTYVDNLAANPLIPYTPTFTGCSTNPTVDSDCCFYTVKGKEVTVFFVTKGVGTSNATTKTITLPIAAATVIGSTSFGYVCGGVTVANSGTFEPGFIRTQKGSNVADVLRSNVSPTFTASGSFNIWGVFTYPID